jgi:hypothetical protein
MLNSWRPITKSARIQTTRQIQGKTKEKLNQIRLFIFQFLKISINLQTALAAEAYLSEVPWLE